ncbi:MAG: hypothetical protein NT025_05195, partial [bacterium]|nr:hypothetical protein [bacterium]
MLYDDEFIRTLPAYQIGRNNQRVVTVCHSKDPTVISFRADIEEWYIEHYSRFPDASKDVHDRLRSEEDDQYVGAYSELLVFSVLRSESG